MITGDVKMIERESLDYDSRPNKWGGGPIGHVKYRLQVAANILAVRESWRGNFHKLCHGAGFLPVAPEREIRGPMPAAFDLEQGTRFC